MTELVVICVFVIGILYLVHRHLVELQQTSMKQFEFGMETLGRIVKSFIPEPTQQSNISPTAQLEREIYGEIKDEDVIIPPWEVDIEPEQVNRMGQWGAE